MLSSAMRKQGAARLGERCWLEPPRNAGRARGRLGNSSLNVAMLLCLPESSRSFNHLGRGCKEPAMLTAVKHQDAVSSLPFDNHLLDHLMAEARIDVALTTS